jgi:hypothetical protein
VASVKSVGLCLAMYNLPGMTFSTLSMYRWHVRGWCGDSSEYTSPSRECQSAVNDSLMWMRLNDKNVLTSIVLVYAFTEVADSNAKDDFYPELDRILKDVPSRDFLIVLSDFNARVICDNRTWRGVVGKHIVYKESNDNGRRLVDICSFHDMCVTGTLFLHKDIHKYTRYQ